MASEARPKPIPELRGFKEIPDQREEKYSVASYSAQYGIAMTDAQEIWERGNTHPQVERMIFAHLKGDPEYRNAVIRSEEIDLLKRRGHYKSKPGVGT